MGCCHRRIHDISQLIDSHLQQGLQTCSDHIEGQIKHQYHDSYKTRDCRVFSCQDPVNLLTPDTFLTLFWFYHSLFTQTFNKIKPHISNRCTPVNFTFCLHLLHDMLQHLPLVLIQL